jgi:hypothetical protein
MLRMNKKLSSISIFLALPLLAPGFFTHGTFSRSTHYFRPLLKAASHSDARAAAFDSRANTDSRFDVEEYGEPAPRSDDFLSAKENTQARFRSFILVRSLSRILLAPKVSRYISKSVLNI